MLINNVYFPLHVLFYNISYIQPKDFIIFLCKVSFKDLLNYDSFDNNLNTNENVVYEKSTLNLLNPLIRLHFLC